MIILGCIGCFLSGAVVALTAAFLCRENKHTAQTSTETPKNEPSEHDMKLREQWINFMNYDGSKQEE